MRRPSMNGIPSTSIDMPLALDSDQYHRTLASAVGALAWLDAQGIMIETNSSLAEWLETDSPSLRGKAVEEFIPGLRGDRWRDIWTSIAGDKSRTFRDQLLLPNELSCPVELTLQRMRSDNADIGVLRIRNIQAQRQTEDIQQLQYDVLEAVASGQPMHATLDLMCRRVESLAPELICTVLLVDCEGRVHPCAAPSMPPIFSQAIDNEPIGPKAGSCGTAAYRGEPVEVTDIANDPLWEDYKALALPLGLAACWSTPIKARNGRVVATFAVYYRETRSANFFHRQMVNACVHLCSLAIEHRESEAQIHRLVFYDTLTSLPNRTLLADRGHQALGRAKQSGRHVALMLIDLDRFKTVNDSLGHGVGDLLLLAVAERLQKAIRNTDTLCRLGSDEFALLALNCNADTASLLAEKLLESLAHPITIGDVEISVTAGIGISVFPEDGRDFETLLRNADMAAHQAKLAGRNVMRFYQPQMNEAATRRLSLEAALRQAIAAGELNVHYQPQIDLDKGQLYGLEALVRWQHAEWGMISPATFIPLAEDCGLIGDIDHFVLDRACHQLATWRQAGWSIPSISVNLSAANFQRSDIIQRVRDVLERHQLPPASLTVEITESLMLNTSTSTLEQLQALRGLGVNLSVDDFGTGYSSLSYLKRFPINSLKLDQSFVRDLGVDADDRALASAIIGIGQALQLRVVAEGVETAEQERILTGQGCKFVQGYFYSRPQSAGDLEAWFSAGGSTFTERRPPV